MTDIYNNDDFISENEIIVLIKLVAVEMSTFLLSEIIRNYFCCFVLQVVELCSRS